MPTMLALSAGLVLTGCAGQSEKPEPTTSPVDEGLSLSPASNEAYRCLIEKGWPVTISWDGGVGTDAGDIPDDQYELYRADADECWAPYDDAITNMSTADMKKVYAQELETRDCLIELGYDDIDEPPSEQEFIDAFPGAGRWSAYAASSGVMGMPDSKWREVNEACPQPAWFFGTW
ncbi:hypothetical protein ASE14_02445 [Agromyces sp. Root81]|uniref:hypothetical protein n=1 Tax=Agromyces sp. Root81 TaxID=1736601 RepID=UPI0006F53375|nr:hypothetical protein [Agromyces sp. Root81]KRC62701.1 hypothetical protein ASE14_02445 [Agromyces sp. Root81]